MNVPYLTEIFFIISILVFLIALFLILPTLFGTEWRFLLGKEKKKGGLSKDKKEMTQELSVIIRQSYTH